MLNSFDTGEWTRTVQAASLRSKINTNEEIERGKAFGAWVRNGLAAKRLRIADLARTLNRSPSYLGVLTNRDGIDKATGAYNRPGEQLITEIANALEIDPNEGRRAAGYVDAEPSDEMHQFQIGEFRGRPVAVLLSEEPTDEQLQRMRIATRIIFSDEGE